MYAREYFGKPGFVFFLWLKRSQPTRGDLAYATSFFGIAQPQDWGLAQPQPMFWSTRHKTDAGHNIPPRMMPCFLDVLLSLHRRFLFLTDLAMAEAWWMIVCWEMEATRLTPLPSSPRSNTYITNDILTKDEVNFYYRQVSNIRRTLLDNQIVDHSDVVGASPVGATPTTSSFSTSPLQQLTSIYCAKTPASWDEKHFSFGIWRVLY